MIVPYFKFFVDASWVKKSHQV